MRLAFVDLVFSWPPAGGAPIDLYHTVAGLQGLGHEVRLFYAQDPTHWWPSVADAGALPFPSTALDFPIERYTPRHVPGAFKEVVDAWGPDVVFVCFGFFLKPYVIAALKDYPTVSRYYAYEAACLRDFRLFKNEATCPRNFMKTPDVCRKCTLDYFRSDLKRGALMSNTREYLDARAYDARYYRTWIDAIGTLDAVIVYNQIARAHFEGIHANVRVVPGAVHLDDFPERPEEDKAAPDRKVVLMSGRIVDPTKGFAVLRDACEALYARRKDFEVWITHYDREFDSDCITSVGWLKPSEVAGVYQRADVCLVPSVWEEPFGIVAVEAMAAGRPVVASRVGGLQESVVHGETGFIYDRYDAAELQSCLERLLDDAGLRRAMGAACRRRVEAHYTWDRVLQTHYPPLLEGLAR
jgi:glycosyltransferase involved in cell wall biosynthesis